MTQRRRWHRSWPALVAVLAALSAGCDQLHQSGGGTAATEAGASSASEAERTRKIEAKAAEIERRAAEIQNMTGTDQEKMDAVNELDKARRELQEMQDAK